MLNTLTIFERIQTALTTMSEAKRSVARYLLENWQEAAFQPASRIARQVGVSESVVVRFAQDLGYAGFPDLQAALQKILRNRLTGLQPTQETVDVERIESTGAVGKVLNLTYKNLQDVQLANPEESFEKAVEFIFKAHRIGVVASRNALGPATILSVHLNEIFTNTALISAGQDDLFDQLRALSQDDLLITIGLPHYSKRTTQAAEFAAERGIPQISLTDSLTSPLAKTADVTLLLQQKSYSFSSSHLSTVFLIDVLIYLITVRGKGKILKSLEEIEMINHRYGLVNGE